MSSGKCLDCSSLLRYINDGYGEQERASIDQHLNSCQRCHEQLKFLTKIRQARLRLTGMSPTKDSRRAEAPQAYFDLERAFFSEGLTGQKHDEFFGYLAKSDACFKEFNRLLKNSISEATADERDFLESLKKTQVHDRLTNYERAFLQSDPASERVRMGDRLKTFINENFSLLRNPWVLAVGASIALCAIIWTQLQNGPTQLEQARSEYFRIARNFTVSDESIRPIGAESFSPVVATRSPQPKTQLEQTHAHLFQALEDNRQSAELNHYVGTVYYYNGHVEEALSYYQKALDCDQEYAPVYNDLALIDLEKKDFASAIEHLSKAMALRPDLIEAYYNLAIVYELAGHQQEALKAWQQYLKVDQDEESSWRQIALQKVANLQKE